MFLDVRARAIFAVLYSFLNKLHEHMVIFGDAVLAKLRFSLHAAKRMWDRALTQAACCAGALSSWLHTCRVAISFSMTCTILRLLVASLFISNTVDPVCAHVLDVLQCASLRVFQALRSTLSGCFQVTVEKARHVVETLTRWCCQGCVAVRALFQEMRHVVAPSCTYVCRSLHGAAQNALRGTLSLSNRMMTSVAHLIEVLVCWCKQTCRQTYRSISRIAFSCTFWVWHSLRAATQATSAFSRTCLSLVRRAASTLWQHCNIIFGWIDKQAATAGIYADFLWHSISSSVCLACTHVHGSLHDAWLQILSAGSRVMKEVTHHLIEFITFWHRQCRDTVLAVVQMSSYVGQNICGIMSPTCSRMWHRLGAATRATFCFLRLHAVDVGTLVCFAMRSTFACGHHMMTETANQAIRVITHWCRKANGAAITMIQMMPHVWQSICYTMAPIRVKSFDFATQVLLSFARNLQIVVNMLCRYFSTMSIHTLQIAKVALQLASRKLVQMGHFIMKALWFLARGVLEVLRCIATTFYNIVYRPRCSVCKTGQAKLRSLCFTCVVDHLVPRCSQCARGWCKIQTRCFSCFIDYYFDNPRCCICRQGFRKLGSHCVTCFLDRHVSRCAVCHRGFQKLGCRCFTCFADSFWSRCNVCRRGYAKIGTKCFKCSKDHVMEYLSNPPRCAVCSRGFAKVGALCLTCFADCFRKRCAACQRGYRKLGSLCVTCYLDQFYSRCDTCHRGYAKIGKHCFKCFRLHLIDLPRCGVCARGYAKFGTRCFTCFKEHYPRCGVCNRGYAKIGSRCFRCSKDHLTDFSRCGVCNRGYAKIGTRCFTCFKEHYPRCGVCHRGYAKIGTRCFGCWKQHITNFPRCGVCQRGYAKVGTRCIACFKENVRARLR